MYKFNTPGPEGSDISTRLILLVCVGLIALTTAKSTVGETAKNPNPDPLQIHFDLEKLPEKTLATIERIKAAARSGELDELRSALEWNELPPEIGPGGTTDPISYWKNISVDGTAREIMAKMLNIFERGYVVQKINDGSTNYIWPYLAKIPLTRLSPRQEVDLHRLATPEEVKSMKSSGKYSGYYVVIGEDGTWHSFMKKN